MNILTADMLTPARSTAELDRLGDEIAELSAHLEAATARLLDLIREFDARQGWSNGFTSCAHWLSWRLEPEVGERLIQALAAARETLYQRTHRTFVGAGCAPGSPPPRHRSRRTGRALPGGGPRRRAGTRGSRRHRPVRARERRARFRG